MSDLSERFRSERDVEEERRRLRLVNDIDLAAKMTTGIVQDQQNLEKQMGCMSGFLQIFDRHQILTGKRLYSTKRLPSSAVSLKTNSSYYYSAQCSNKFQCLVLISV